MLLLQIALKTTICAIAILGCTWVASALDDASIKSPIELSNASLDFGIVDPHETPEKTITISNRGSSPVKLLGARITCECTQTDLKPSTIRPGESISFNVTLNLVDYPSDRVRSRIDLTVDDESVPIPTVEVSADIRPELVIEPPIVDFGNVRSGQPATETMKISRDTHARYRIVSVENTSGVMAVLESSGDKDTQQFVRVTLLPNKDARRYNGSITLLTNIHRKPAISVPVRARFVGIECVISPPVIVFRELPPGAFVGSISVLGQSGLRIASVESDSQYLTTEVSADKKLGKHALKIALTPDTPSGEFSARLTLTLRENGLIETRYAVVTGSVDRKLLSW